MMRRFSATALRLRFAQPDAALRDDAEAGILELGVDLAGKVPARGVRLDDGKRALDGHGEVPDRVARRSTGAAGARQPAGQDG
jgi:hypothetical protein